MLALNLDKNSTGSKIKLGYPILIISPKQVLLLQGNYD